MKVKSESEVAQSCLTRQTPPFMGFSRQEDWSGVPVPSLGSMLDSHRGLSHTTCPEAILVLP